MPRLFTTLFVLGFVGVGLAAWLVDAYWLGAAFVVTAVVGAPVSAWALLRRHDARPSVSTLLVASSAAGAFTWVFYYLDARWYWKALLLVAVVAPLMSLANVCVRSDIRAAQAARDARAAALTQQILSGTNPAPGFTLYLRPFATTSRLGAQALPAEVSTDLPVHLDLESLLRRALEPLQPLIGLGLPGDTQEGAARVRTSDAEWRSVVTELITHASRVVMVPLARPGTTWELGHLVDAGMLDKLVLVMPETVAPTPSGVLQVTERSDRLFEVGIERYSPSEHTLDMPTEWEAACRAAAELHMELPPYAPCGAMMTIESGSGRMQRIVPLPVSTLARRVTAVRLLLNSVTAGGTPPNRSISVVAALQGGLGTRHGRTLEYNYVRAADGYIHWGRIDDAVVLLREAAAAGRRKHAITTWYLGAVPRFVQDALDLSLDQVAASYAAAAQRILLDPTLSRLLSRQSPGSTTREASSPPATGRPPGGPS